MQESEHLKYNVSNDSTPTPQEQPPSAINIDYSILSQLFAQGVLPEVTQHCLERSRQELQIEIVKEQSNNPGLAVGSLPQSNQNYLKLPKVDKIYEVIANNQQLVIDHIIKKREVKSDFKAEWKLQRIDQEFQTPCATQSDVKTQEDNIGQEQVYCETSTNASNQTIIRQNLNPSYDQISKAKQQFVQRVDEIDFTILQQFAQRLSQNNQHVQERYNVQQVQNQVDTSSKANGNEISKSQKSRQKHSIQKSQDIGSSKISDKKKAPVKRKQIKAQSDSFITMHKPLTYTGYISKTETDSENEDRNSEDEKFEKKLKKYSFVNKEFVKEEANRSSRPRRNAASNMSYQQQFQGGRHDHSHYQLISYNNYKSISAQPYIIYISVEVLLMLNIHSHLSEYEVIGFLGGFYFESKDSRQKCNVDITQQYVDLFIHSAYPCDSLVQNQRDRQKNVELCPLSADCAREQIQSKGQQLLGWYHSHPFFPVEPSQIDVKNHAVYQKDFEMSNMPFIALIIGPYSQKSKKESLLKIFHLVNDSQPYNLNYKLMPCTALRKSLLQDIKDIFIKYSSHQDTIDLQEKWACGLTRQEKLIEVLELVLQRNLQVNEKFNLESDILRYLNDSDVKKCFLQYPQQSFTNSINSSASTSTSDITETTRQIDQQMVDESKMQQKRDGYFSIKIDEKIEKFSAKIEKMLQKYLYGQNSSDEEDNGNNI